MFLFRNRFKMLHQNLRRATKAFITTCLRHIKILNIQHLPNYTDFSEINSRTVLFNNKNVIVFDVNKQFISQLKRFFFLRELCTYEVNNYTVMYGKNIPLFKAKNANKQVFIYISMHQIQHKYLKKIKIRRVKVKVNQQQQRTVVVEIIPNQLLRRCLINASPTQLRLQNLNNVGKRLNSFLERNSALLITLRIRETNVQLRSRQ